MWRVRAMPNLVRIALLLGIEYAFNVGEASGAANDMSSTVLQSCHMLLLMGVALGEVPSPTTGCKLQAEEQEEAEREEMIEHMTAAVTVPKRGGVRAASKRA